MSDPLCILRRDDALFGEHRRVRLAGGNVLPVKVTVEVDRGVDVRHDRVGTRTEPAAPHFVAHDTSTEIQSLMTEPFDPSMRKIGRLRLVSAAAAAAVLVVLAGVYGIEHLRSNPGDAACQAAVNTAKKLAPLVHGEVAALALAQTPFRVPDLAFKDANGQDRTLADWRGRTVLLNLWATWCVPCRREMPALDAVQTMLGGPDFDVVAVNIDTRDPQKPLAFLKEIGVTHLTYYSDAQRQNFRGLEGGRQSVRHADHRHRRPLRLRDRRHGRPGRMGKRRWRQAHWRGDRSVTRLASIAGGG